MIFECIRCGARFIRISHYTSHKDRKTVCRPILSQEIPTDTNYKQIDATFACTTCGETFADHNSLKRHVCKHAAFFNNVSNILQNMNEHIKKQSEEIQSVKNDVKTSQEELKQQLFSKLDSAIVSRPNHDPSNFNLVNNNILNLDFKIENNKDSKDFISNDRKYHLLNRGMNAMPFLVKDVNFDPEHPENHNMYISNNKTKTAQVKENGVWVKRDGRQLVIDIMYDYDCRYFRGFAENPDLEEEYPKATQLYYKYIEITESKEAKKKIENELIEMLYNNREMIMETRKKEEQVIKQRKLAAAEAAKVS
jgi:uncharacterized C2H2 Zn-finger protein